MLCNMWSKPLKNIFELIHFLSNYKLKAWKFTKTELLHKYFSGILTSDLYGNFTVVLNKFLKTTAAISRNTIFPEHLQWLLPYILKIKPSILKSLKKNKETCRCCGVYRIKPIYLPFYLPNFFSGKLIRKNNHKIKIKRIQIYIYIYIYIYICIYIYMYIYI